MRDHRHSLRRGLIALAVTALCVAFPGLASASTAPSWSDPAAITTQAPFADQGTLNAVSCADSSDCYAGAVNGTDTGVIYGTGDGGRSWTIARAPNADGGGPFACAPDTGGTAPFCIAIQGDEIENLSAAGTPVTGPSNYVIPLELANALSCPSAGLCVATGASGQNGEIDWSTSPLSGAWSNATIDLSHALTAISCPDAGLCVAVDSGGGVEVSTDPAGGSWTRTQVASGLDAVSCPTDSWCVAVSSSGGAYVSTTPASGNWSAVAVPAASTDLVGVSCPTTSFCALSDASGAIDESANPAAGFTAVDGIPGVDGASPSAGQIACVAGGACEVIDSALVAVNPDLPGTAASDAGGTSHPEPWSEASVYAWTPLTALSCPSQALCVAAEQDGRILTTTAPLNQSAGWGDRSADPDGTPVALACTTAGPCFGVDSSGHLLWSASPASGSWIELKLDNRAKPVAISCPSASFCAFADAGGRIFTSTDPAGTKASDWHMITRATPTKVSHEQTETLTALTCPSARFCLATDSGGWIYTSTDPTGGARAWKATQIWKRPSGGFYSLTGAACPTAGRCVVTATDSGWFGESQYDPDALGTYALSTSHPTGGAAKWSSRHVDGGYVESDASTNDPGIATGVSCPTLSLCAIVDDLGTADTNTGAATSSSWKQASIDGLATPDGSDGVPGLTGVSCFAGGHCVAVDGFGNRFVFGIGAGPITPAAGITYQGP